MDANNNNPLVAIRCMTFNHKPYIQQCLDGFVMQKTDFPFVAIVVDDNSTDKEQGVLWDFINSELDSTFFQKDETNDFVRVVATHKTNNNCTFVFIFLKYNHYSIKKAKAPYFENWEEQTKYIAFCEGDDYWIDPLKLQKQVDFLESHPDYSLVRGDINRFFQKDGKTEERFFKNDKYFKNIKDTFEDYVYYGYFAAPCTWMYRTEYYKDRPNLPSKFYFNGDTNSILHLSSKGKVFFMDDVLAVYRVLGISASHFKTHKEYYHFYIKALHTQAYYARKLSLIFRLRFYKNQCVKRSRRQTRNIKSLYPLWFYDCCCLMFFYLFFNFERQWKNIETDFSK